MQKLAATSQSPLGFGQRSDVPCLRTTDLCDHRTLAQYTFNCNWLLGSDHIKAVAKRVELCKQYAELRGAKKNKGERGRGQREPTAPLGMIPSWGEGGLEQRRGEEHGVGGGWTLAQFQEKSWSPWFTGLG